MEPEERLNDDEGFFPFVPAGRGDAIFVNKHNVISLAFVAPLRSDDESPTATERPVRIECEGLTLEGTLVIAMPPSNRRVLDYLNRTELFLSLLVGDRLHLVSRRHILRVAEFHP